MYLQTDVARDLDHRVFRFACRIVDVFELLNAKGGAARVVGYQLLDAGTSVGSNYEEAGAGQAKADFTGNTRSKFPPKIFAFTSVPRPISSSAADCCWCTSFTHPRGKNDESVPNSNRSGPSTASACLKTAGSVSPGVYLIQLLELEVSNRTFEHRSATINASRRRPAPKCGTMIGSDG